MDQHALRSIMGAFPKGVTVVTTVDATGAPRGLTPNDVASVSSEPPMLLVCINKTSTTLAALRHSRKWAVNYLLAGTSEVSNQFATKLPDKFFGVEWRPGELGVPVLQHAALAYAECTTHQEIDAGDHVILIGMVAAGQPPAPGTLPLMYFRRTYATWSEDHVEGSYVPQGA